MLSGEARRNSNGNETVRTESSGTFTTYPSSASLFAAAPSPKQVPQHNSSAVMLPSPSSIYFPNVHNLPSISPPSTSAQIAAQGAHLQDLQHQVSVKTLAFQTLQREHDSLLQTLERQKTKCATLEKKFQVSDVEIISLTDEKEKLNMQVVVLEGQVEELRQSRDEARQQSVANGAQYMRIMEMANRLQIQGAEAKKKWEAEKSELKQRIQLLEEAMVTGLNRPMPSAEQQSPASPTPQPVILAQHLAASSPSEAETIKVLRAEVSRLQSRTQTVETALRTMQRESVSIQAAARQLLASGDKLEKAAQNIVGD